MCKTIKEYIELFDKLQARALELIGEKDQQTADEEVKAILKRMKDERPEVTKKVYKKSITTGRLEQVGELNGIYQGGWELFNDVKKEMLGLDFEIVIQKDAKGYEAHTQKYKVNDENYIITFTKHRNMQKCFEDWSKAIKEDLKIVSSLGVTHEVKYNKDFERATFN